jgi:hypothetical protein
MAGHCLREPDRAGSKNGDPHDAGGDPRCGEAPAGEFEALLSPDGTVIFSWNTAGIQMLARALGIPEFDPPRWCG